MSADADSGDNDGNDDVAAIDDTDDGDDIRADDDPNTHLSHHNTAITIRGAGPHRTKETRVMTKQLFRDSASIVLLGIPVKKKIDSYHNDDVKDACTARVFTIIPHRLDYAFTARYLVIALTLTIVIVFLTNSIARFNTDSRRRLTQPLVITLTLLRISNLSCS